MSLSITTNTSAINAAYNLDQSNAKLQHAIAELSSGSKIVNPSDDAGGLAVSMQMNATIAETNATNTNVADAQSFLQTQDGSLNVASSILTRMAELQTMALDPTKSASDVSNYNSEFTQLQSQLSDLSQGTFNGVALFSTAAAGTQMSVDLSVEAPSGAQTITQSALGGNTDITALLATTAVLGPGTATVTAAQLSAALSAVATMTAQNGAESSGLNFAAQTLSTTSTNLQAAVGQITDVDVAAASTELAKDNVLVQAGASMLSQANSSSQIALKLLGGS